MAEIGVRGCLRVYVKFPGGGGWWGRGCAGRELMPLCRKTIIPLIEPPGSESLQPEPSAPAERAQRAGGVGEEDEGSADEGSGSGPKFGGVSPPALRER